jgi:hypothetical protein
VSTMRFVDPGVGTVNEEYLFAALAHHGKLVASGREICYRRDFGPQDERFIGDCFGVFEDEGTFSVVGVEIKDWAAPVTPKLASTYLSTYGVSCDFVYLAARRFLPGVKSVKGIGLIDLEGPKVVRPAARLDPEPEAWRYVISQLEGGGSVAARHPRQQTLARNRER